MLYMSDKNNQDIKHLLSRFKKTVEKTNDRARRMVFPLRGKSQTTKDNKWKSFQAYCPEFHRLMKDPPLVGWGF